MNRTKIIIIVGVVALVICMLLIGLLRVAGYRGWPTSEAAAIEDTIRGYVTTFNAEDFDKCLTYFADYGDKEDALAFLSFIRSLSGPLELREIKDIAIFPPDQPGNSQTATATVIFIITGEEGIDQIRLKEINGKWKIIWEQQGAPGEAVTVEDTITGYLEAYNAEDFDTCLNYLPSSIDRQVTLDSLSWLRGYVGEVNLQWADLSVSDQTATALLYVAALGNSDMDLTMHLEKENDFWKIVQSRGSFLPTLTPTQGFMSGTVDIAPELQGVLQIKHSFWFEADGILWHWYYIKNIGDQAVRLSIELQAYNAEGRVFELGGFGDTVEPEWPFAGCAGSEAEDIRTATHYKIIVKSM